jgi:hypothetical protein
MTKTKEGRVWRSISLAVLITIAVSAAADSGLDHQKSSNLFGTSGGNVKDISNLYCCSGTLGSLVQDSLGNKYILSNNHVLARSNSAAIGEDISQPGLIDNGCRVPTIVADLSAYPSLSSNVDAAIAALRAGTMDSSGSILDIGSISSQPLPAFVGLQVQKSGRTTGLTSGTVSSINTNVTVNYQPTCGMGKKFKVSYRNQVVVSSSTFSAGGDSGSLILSKPSSGLPQPVALLYAGSSTTTVGNPIGEVLNQLSASLGRAVSFVGSGSTGSALISGGATSSVTPQAIQQAHAAKERWADAFMNRPGVLGVGVGLTDDGSEAAVIVYVDNSSALRPTLPERADGARVKVVFTDPFVSR